MPNINNIHGSILIRPVQAKLYRDVELFKKMDPYVMITIGDLSLKGTVDKNGGKTPKWNDIMAFGIKNGTKVGVIELMDKDKITADDIIGICEIDLAEAESAEKQMKWHEVYHKNKLAGELLLETIFVSDQYLESPLLYVDNKRADSQVIYNHNAYKHAGKHVKGFLEKLQHLGLKIERKISGEKTERRLSGEKVETKIVERKRESPYICSEKGAEMVQPTRRISWRDNIEVLRFENRVPTSEEVEEKSQMEGDASLLSKSVLEQSTDFLLI